jgi:hypothetical protein
MSYALKYQLFWLKTGPKLCFINATRRIDQNETISSIPALQCVYMSPPIVSPPLHHVLLIDLSRSFYDIVVALGQGVKAVNVGVEEVVESRGEGGLRRGLDSLSA